MIIDAGVSELEVREMRILTFGARQNDAKVEVLACVAFEPESLGEIERARQVTPHQTALQRRIRSDDLYEVHALSGERGRLGRVTFADSPEQLHRGGAWDARGVGQESPQGDGAGLTASREVFEVMDRICAAHATVMDGPVVSATMLISAFVEEMRRVEHHGEDARGKGRARKACASSRGHVDAARAGAGGWGRSPVRHGRGDRVVVADGHGSRVDARPMVADGDLIGARDAERQIIRGTSRVLIPGRIFDAESGFAGDAEADRVAHACHQGNARRGPRSRAAAGIFGADIRHTPITGSIQGSAGDTF